MLDYYQNMAGPEALQPVVEVWEVLQDFAVLQKLRITTGPADLPLAGFTEQGRAKLLQEENEIVTKMGFTACCLVGKQVASSLWSLVGPGKLAALLHKQELQRKAALVHFQNLKQWHEAAVAQAARNPDVQEQVSASFLNDPIPKQTVDLLKEAKFKETPAQLQRAIECLFSVGNTVVNEQANRAARDAEEMQQDNKKVSNERLLLAPMKAQVLQSPNKFEELTHQQWTAQHEKEARTQKLGSELFKPKACDIVLPLKEVQGSKQDAPYETGTPASLNKMYAHVFWWSHCCKVESDWGLTKRLWLSELLPVGTVVRFKVSGAIGVIVQHIEHRAALAWPMARTTVSGEDFFVPATKPKTNALEMLHFFFVSNPEQFEAYRTAWVGPAYGLLTKGETTTSASSRKKAKTAASDLGGVTLRLVQKKPTSVLEASARQCFLPMAHSTLRGLAAEYGVAASGCSHFDLALKLLRHFLPHETPDEWSSLLDMRSNHNVDSYSDLLESEEIRDAFGDAERKHLEEHLQQQRKPARREFAHALKSYRQTESKKAVKRQQAEDKTGAGEKKLISNGLRLYPTIVRAQKLSEEEALLFLPPHSHVKKRSIDNRWELKWSCNKRTRTWSRYGEVEAFALCAGYLWDCFHEAGGQKCPHEWILRICKQQEADG